jgi:hypothetical protein
MCDLVKRLIAVVLLRARLIRHSDVLRSVWRRAGKGGPAPPKWPGARGGCHVQVRAGIGLSTKRR